MWSNYVVGRITFLDHIADEVRAGTQKEARIIDTLEPVLNQHRLVVDKSIIEKDAREPQANFQLFYQLTRITRERNSIVHDDRLDALAWAVAYWVAYMARDVETVEDERLEELRQQELENFMDHALGRDTKAQANWAHGWQGRR